jgi:uncharacterized protein (TIGR02145 family)
MKNITINRIASTILMILLVSYVSCNKDDSLVKSTDNSSLKNLINVTGETSSPSLKTTLNGLVTEWIQTTDKVGIYSPEARTATGGGGTEIVNAEFTAASSGTVSDFTGTMYWGALSTLHHFYSYYPYADGTPSSNLVPVSLASEQTQSAANNSDHIGLLDFMVGTPVSVTSPANTNQIGNEVNFHYNHLFTLLNFQITGTGSLTKVRLSGLGTLAFSTGNIDITQATPSAGIPYTFTAQSDIKSDVVVSLTSAATLSGTATNVYMMICPGSPVAELYIGLEIDGSWKYIQKTGAPSGTFERGKYYIVNVDASTATAEPVYPESLTNSTLLAGRWWAPVNAGYATTVYGLLYQWNRKAGQTYDESPLPTITDGPVSVTVGNDASANNTFYSIDANPRDWCTPQSDAWDLTNYNPCPTGWRVPTKVELQSLVEAGSTWTSSGGPDALAGRWFGGDHGGTHVGSLFLSASGLRYFSAGQLIGRPTEGTYWSSEVFGTNANTLDFYSEVDGRGAFTTDWYPAAGLSIRCVKE